MIPLHKLKALPRTLRLRKIASLFGGAQSRFITCGFLSSKEAEYLAALTELLASDGAFTGAALEVLKTAGLCFLAAENKTEIRRALNNVYHLVLTETGRTQADWDFVEPGGILDASKRQPFPGMQVYLEDIRSPFNVGSIFRAAESFGAEKLWLSPLCACPMHKRAQRSAMGCIDILPWERLSFDPFSAAAPADSEQSFLQGPFFTLETGGTPLSEFSFPPRGIMIAGGEELGVSPGALAASDASLGRVSIPIRGAKGSLNVAVAFGIVMQAWAAALEQ